MPSQRDARLKKFVIVVEGDSDRACLLQLLSRNDLHDYCVIAPSDISKGLGGRGTFTRILNSLPMRPAFGDVEAVLLVSDNDDSPEHSFAEVARAIEAAEPFGEPPHKYPVPQSPRAKAHGNPSIVVYMVPGVGTPGNLEIWCLEAAKKNHSHLLECVEILAKCAELQNWRVPQQAKAKIRSLIAIAHERKPDISLQSVWEEIPDLFPSDADAFADLTRFLQDFPRLISG